MRIPVAANLALCVLLTACLRPQSRPAPQMDKTPTQPNEIRFVYDPPTWRHRAVGKKYWPVVTALRGWLEEMVALSKPLTVRASECDRIAFYDPNIQTIVLCYGFLSDLETDSQMAESSDFAEGALKFILLHELGHALIDLLDLPVIGGEEDAADRFAITFMGQSANLARWMPGAANFFQQRPSNPKRSASFAGVHPVSEQRFYTILCGFAGGQPQVFEQMVAPDVLPTGRHQRCAEEYDQAKRAWNELLRPHSRVQGGVTFF